MKNNLLFLALLMALPFVSFGQAHIDTIPAYLKNTSITAISSFQLLTDTVVKKTKVKGYGKDSVTITKDSILFTNADFPKNKTVVIIYFSPDCGHCQHEAEDIAKSMDSGKFHNTFFLWASYHPLKDIKAFFPKYHLAKFDNIHSGRDLKYTIPSYFKVEFTPYIAVYNKDGKFVKEFRMGATSAELEAALAL